MATAATWSPSIHVCGGSFIHPVTLHGGTPQAAITLGAGDRAKEGAVLALQGLTR